ncbi:MAG: phosphomannomutase/phosphoglucomutase [Patescibacteria group bacterium]|nr:phosphomannomutase/phosphoglucomutase [Patescibacteria group bacterium]
MINPKAFREYDIRGIYPSEVNEEVAYKTGCAFVRFLNKNNPEIAVGRDGRISSESLFNSFKKGVTDSGGVVLNVGLSTTPMLNFAIYSYKCSGGAIITASHNLSEFNGIKLMKEEAAKIYGDDLQKIKKIAEDIKLDEVEKKEEKDISEKVLEKYTSYIVSFGKNIKNIKVVVDYGNSVSSLTGVPVFKKLKINVVNLYQEVDGRFPNHNPEPKMENASELIKTIKKEGASVGVSFDGDGDRVLIFDNEGEMIPTDALISFLIKEEISESKEKRVYLDLCFSKSTFKEIEKQGGKITMMRVGSSFYREKLINEGGLLGAELSGHIMHKDNFYIDDGLFAAVKVLNLLSSKNEELSKLIKPFKNYHRTPAINIEVKNKDEVLKKVEDNYLEGKKIEIDGVYIEFNDWWFNLRKSNTENVVRLVVEAETEELLKQKKEELLGIIN